MTAVKDGTTVTRCRKLDIRAAPNFLCSEIPNESRKIRVREFVRKVFFVRSSFGALPVRSVGKSRTAESRKHYKTFKNKYSSNDNARSDMCDLVRSHKLNQTKGSKSIIHLTANYPVIARRTIKSTQDWSAFGVLFVQNIPLIYFRNGSGNIHAVCRFR